MSEKQQPPIMDQKLCVNGCGFFGSSSTSHMCSKCWKDTMSQTMMDAETKKDGAANSAPLPSLSKSSSSAMDDTPDTPVSGSPTPSGPSSAAFGNPADEQAPFPPAPATTTPPTPPAAASATDGFLSTARPADLAVAPPQAPSVAVAAVAAAAAASVAPAVVLPASPMSFSNAGRGTGVGPRVSSMSVGGGAKVEGAAGTAVAEAAVAEAAAETPAMPEQKNRKRCFTCSKKVGYTGIACRCSYVFCSLHRYPEQHDCTFDFKTSDRNDLKRTVIGGGQFSKVDRL